MPEGGALHAAAHQVQAAVPDPHDMEWVGDPDRVLDAAIQGVPVGLGQIGRHDGDPVEPRRWLGIQPFRDIAAGVPRDHIDDPARVQVHQAGGEPRGMVPVRLQPGGLIDPKHRHIPNPGRIVNQRLADLGDRVHDGVPGHPQLPGHLGDRAGVDPHLDAALDRRPPGEQTPGHKLIPGLGPAAQITPRMRAPVPALAPHQPDRPPERRQIPVLHRHPFMRHRDTRAGRAHHRLRERLDAQHQLDIRLDCLQHPEAGQAKHHLGNASSVRHVGDPTFVAAVR